MKRIDALKAILAKINAGNLVPDNLVVDAETSAQIDAAVNVSDLHGDAWADLLNAYDGSLDAAKALHIAMLPIWEISRFTLGGWVRITSTRQFVSEAFCHENTARAWLAAILHALVQQEEANETP